MSHVELVQVRTADGLRLVGALAMPKHVDSPRQPPVDAVLCVHGTGSNFYASALFEGLASKLLADGIAVLRVNTRGHDVLSIASTLHGPQRAGSALEHVDDCRHDLVAWLECLAARGCQSVALVGHSLGAIKALYTAVRMQHPALVRLVAISPPRLSHAHYLSSEKRDEFLAHYRLAQEHLAAGHGEALMEIKTPLPFLVSAASFIDKYGPEEKYNFLRELDRINLPTLFAFGDVELQEMNFRGLPEAILAAASPAQNIRVVTIAGANHIYTGQIDELAHKIRAWLATN
ncbi:MAG TPA: alpha/beta fold hydrolase [Pirellulales bacterium]|jgi:pimeloyl-ACP methyl ester carboxylesterase|nr:alpha/beta fold hydrolase [Pirellulales bacterium]